VYEHGDEVVLILEDGEIRTYKEVYNMASNLSVQLRRLGLKKNEAVAVDTDRHYGLPILIMGIWLSGCSYLPLGSRNSFDRKKEMLDVTSAQIIIVDSHTSDIAKYQEAKFQLLHWPLRESSVTSSEQVEPILGDISYYASTSGSTGKPKVIQISQRAFASYIVGRKERVPFDSKDRVMQAATTSFDVHVFDNVYPLMVGAAVIMVPEKILLDSKTLMNLLTISKCTYIGLVPSVWMHHVNSGASFPPTLRYASLGGEKISRDNFVRLSEALPSSTIMLNSYGPAECTIQSTITEIDRGTAVIRLGQPLSSHLCHIAAPDGVIGELWIGGPCVMDGYKNAPNPCVDGWYPTGDLCYRVNGEYIYLGRRDFQVKLRGQRIEPGEIESILGHQAVVLKDPSREILVAFVVGEPSLESELRTICQKKLPEYMVPSKIICLAAMPLSANGKLGRKQLLDSLRKETLSTSENFLPLNPREIEIRSVWANILGMKEEVISVSDNFFELGGHSLLAATLANILCVPLEMVYKYPTIRSQALHIAPNHGTVIPAYPEQKRGPASMQQQQIFLHMQVTSADYLIPFKWQFPVGSLDLDKLKLILKATPVLRTSVGFDDTRSAIVQILKDRPPEVDVFTGEDNSSVLKDWFQDRKEQINVAKGVMSFFGLFPETGVLIGIVHHLATDGLGLEKLRKRILSGDTQERRPSYIDYCYWQVEYLKYATFERPDLSFFTSPFELVVPSELMSPEKRSYSYPWPKSIENSLAELKYQPDQFPWLLQRVSGALHRFTNSPKGLVVASTVANQVIDTVGLMVNTVLYCWNPSMSFEEWKDHMIHVQSMVEMPLNHLKLPLHPESHLPLTPFMVTWQPGDLWWKADTNTKNQFIQVQNQLGVRVRLSCTHFCIDCNWKDEVIESLWQEIISPSELARPSLSSVPGESFRFTHPVEIWLDCVKAHENDTAVIMSNGEAKTYSQLFQLAASLSHKLQQQGLKKNDVVAVDIARHLCLPAIIFGIWLTGCAYLPLGSKNSADRKVELLRVTEAKAIVVATVSESSSRYGTDIPLVPFDPEDSPLVTHLDLMKPTLGDIAYFPSTSGSTGLPKVIQIGHRAFSNYFFGRQERVPFGLHDRIAQAATTSFDVHVFDNVFPLLLGAATIMVPESMMLDSEALMEFLTTHRCTYIGTVPSVWMHYMNSKAYFPGTLRYASFGGEKMSRETFAQIASVLPPSTIMLNSYGPAECTIQSHIAAIDRKACTIALGKPLNSHLCHISAPDCAIGELWIGGPCVMDGYKNSDNPCVDGWYPTGDLCYRLKGEYVYVGRRDFQVKLRGQRIELGEIEHVLAHQAVVIKDPEREILIAFVVGDPSLESELQALCKAKLPEYMVPSKIITLESIPMNANGKSDRKKLLEILSEKTSSSPVVDEKLSPKEVEIRSLWAKILGITDETTISVLVSFFELGGHSLLAATLSHALRTTLDIVYKHSTIRSQAANCHPRRETVLAQPHQKEGPASMQQRQIFLHIQSTNREYYIPFCWRFSVGTFNLEKANIVLASIPELRTAVRFSASRSSVIQVVEALPPRIEIISSGPDSPDFAAKWISQRKKLIEVQKGKMMVIGFFPKTGTVIGIVHHLVTDGVGLEKLRKRILTGDDHPRNPSYLDYCYWQEKYLKTQNFLRPDLTSASLIESAVPSSLQCKKTRYTKKWPSSILQSLSDLNHQPDQFPWLLQKISRALHRFTTLSSNQSLAIASPVANQAIDTVGLMVNTVLYCWNPAMSFEEWKAHMIQVQSLIEMPLNHLKLPLHPESNLPLTPFLVAWQQEDWSNNDNNFNIMELNDQNYPGCWMFLSNEYLSIICSWKELVVESLWNEILCPSDLQRPMTSLPPSLDIPFVHPLSQWLNIVDNFGDNTALIYDVGKTISHREMLDIAMSLSAKLRRLGLKKNDVVAVDTLKHKGLPAIIFGIWLTGCSYIAVGSRNTFERKRYIMEAANANVVVVDEHMLGSIEEQYTDYTVIPFVDIVPPQSEILEPIFGDVAFFPSTSGSTGSPKVIQLSHNALFHLTCGWQATCPVLPTDKFMQSSSTSFDAHVLEAVFPFLFGASLILVQDEMILKTEDLMRHLSANNCTFMLLVPSVWMHHIRSGFPLPPTLRVAIFAGENMKVTDVKKLLAAIPPSALCANLYGPAECTIGTTFSLVNENTEVVPLGMPFISHVCHIAAPDGVNGELWIGGPCVMDEYKNAPNPCINGWYPSGDICYRVKGEYFYVGRRDFQVKLRGQRIELGEIESVLGHQAVVMKDPERERLIAFVFGPSNLSNELFALCEQHLPEYMVPAKIICLESMPMNANGKTDRKQLLSKISEYIKPKTGGEIMAGLTPNEKFILSRISDVLGVPATDPAEHFFRDLGGDSLSAATLSAALDDKISISDIYALGTGYALAKKLDCLSEQSGTSETFPVPRYIDWNKKVSSGNYLLFSLAQAVGGLVWAAQYCVLLALSIWLSKNYLLGQHIVLQIFVALLGSAIFQNSATICWIRVLWVGWHQPGKFPRFGFVHWKWWWLQQLWKYNSIWTSHWLDTFVGTIILKLVGVNVELGARVCTSQIDSWDHVSISSSSFVQDAVHLHNVRVTSQGFFLDSISIGRGTVVGAGSVVMGGVVIGENSVVRNRSWVGIDVPSLHDVSGNPPQLCKLTSPPLPAKKSATKRFIFEIMLVFIAIFYQCLQTMLYSVLFLYNFEKIEVRLLVSSIYIIGIQLFQDFFWGCILRSFCHVSASDGAYATEYGSWNYFRIQRARLFIGRALGWSQWGFSSIQKYLLRISGLKLGDNVEVAGPVFPQFQIPFPFVSIEKNATLTSSVWVGEEHWTDGVWNISKVKIESSSMIGDTGCVLSGRVPPKCIVASLAVVHDSGDECASHSIALGNRALWTNYRASKDMFNAVLKEDFWNSFSRHILDMSFAFIRVIFAKVPVILMLLIFGISGTSFLNTLTFASIVAASSLFGGFFICLLVRHLTMGKFRAGSYEIFSFWFYRRQFYLSYTFNWYNGIISFWFGSEVLNCVLRLLGTSIGSRVIIEQPQSILEMDLVTIGDDCVIEANSIVQPHTFEGRVMSVVPVEIHSQVLVGSHAVILPGSVIESLSQLECLTLIMKNQKVKHGSFLGGGTASPFYWKANIHENTPGELREVLIGFDKLKAYGTFSSELEREVNPFILLGQ
jgi:non-ribosomal peptide synthetase-like protein